MIDYILLTVLVLIISYLSGCVNYAIIVTRLVTGKDIRAMGNLNPGTANVVRNVGKGWGILVGFLDAMKGMALLIIARLFIFTENSELDFAILYAMGIMAVVGHCKPVFYKFKGGGGIGTMQGVSLFFVPVEYAASMLLGGVIVLGFFKHVTFKFGRWTPIMFVILLPFMTLGLNFLIDVPLFAHISIGGHPWSVVAGTFVMSLFLLGINFFFMKQRVKEAKGEQTNG